jgi:hypothetical protein
VHGIPGTQYHPTLLINADNNLDWRPPLTWGLRSKAVVVDLRLRCRQQFRARSHPFKGLYIHCVKGARGGRWVNEWGGKAFAAKEPLKTLELKKEKQNKEEQ